MARESFQEQLCQLRNDILQMGNLVENAIAMTAVAMANQDLEMAQKVVMEDDNIDQLQLAIENRCLSLLALQQPMARDLRFIGTALKINTDLERMGDYARNISKIVLRIGNEPLIKPLVDLPRMAELAQQMVRENLTAFVQQDRVLALQAARHDRIINKLYKKTFTELVELMARSAMAICSARRKLSRTGNTIVLSRMVNESASTVSFFMANFRSSGRSSSLVSTKLLSRELRWL